MKIPAFVSQLLPIMGQMRTAVVLLGLCALASMTGTVVVQGLALPDYVAGFGPFWAQVLWYAGLTDVFRAWWFVAVLGFLLVSVSVCVVRNGPGMVKGMRITGLQGYRITGEGIAVEEGRLRELGFRRVGEVDRYAVWQRGVLNRIGYFCVHVGVLGVAVAGMVSGFVGWRGTLNLREGEADNVVLVWRGSEATPKFLPFAVRNDGFVIEQYPSGMPKRYATTLRFEEPGSQVARNQGAEDKQVEVNRPVRFGAYAFYQASFGDGGSKVAGKGVNLSGGRVVPFEGHVYDKARLLDGTRVEIVDFRPFTVETQAGQKPVDVGPSVDYLVQPPDAEAVQLRAYLQHPELVGVADGQKIGGANDGAVVYRMVKVGGQVGRDAGGQEAWWRMMGRILGGEDFKAVAGPELAGIADEDLRVETGLELMQAVKVVKALKLTHVLLLEDFELKRYSGLQVAYDPGATPFWIAACLLVLGVVLMVGRRFSRVFVKDGMGFVVSPHGIRVVREVEGELRSGEADYS